MSSYRDAPYPRRDGGYSGGGGYGGGRDKEEPRHTLYLRGFAPDTTEEEALTFLRRYGEIQRTHSQLEKKRSMFVTFYDLRSANKALQEIPGQRLKNSRLEAHYALPKNRPSEEDENMGTVFVALDGARNGTIDTAELRTLVEGWGIDVREVRSARGSQARFVECWDLRHSAKLVEEHQNHPYRGGRLKFKYALPKLRDDDRFGPGAVRGPYERDRERERDYAVRSQPPALSMPASLPMPLALAPAPAAYASVQPAVDFSALTAQLLSPSQALPQQYAQMQPSQSLFQQLQQQLQPQPQVQLQPQAQQHLQQLLAAQQGQAQYAPGANPFSSALMSALAAQQQQPPQQPPQQLQFFTPHALQLQQPQQTSPALLFLNQQPQALQQQLQQQQQPVPQQAPGASAGSAVGAAGSTVQQLAALLQLQHQLAQAQSNAAATSLPASAQQSAAGNAAASAASRFGSY